MEIIKKVFTSGKIAIFREFEMTKKFHLRKNAILDLDEHQKEVLKFYENLRCNLIKFKKNLFIRKTYGVI